MTIAQVQSPAETLRAFGKVVNLNPWVRKALGRLSAPQLASNNTDGGKLNVGLPSIKSVGEIQEPEGDVNEKTSTEDKGLSDSILGDLSRFKQEHPSLQNISVVTSQTIDDDRRRRLQNKCNAFSATCES